MDKLLLPKLGQTIEQAELVQWFVAEGDEFALGDEIYEVETDKSNVAVEATVAGRLARIVVREGETVPVGTVVAVVAGADEAVDDAGVDAFLGGATPLPVVTPDAVSPTTERLTGVRRQVARVVAESWREIPQFQQQALVDASGLLAERERRVPKVSLNHLLVDCVVDAAVEVPAVNATYVDDTITTHPDVNLSVAVATPRGLLAPVVHRAQALSPDDRAAAVTDLAARAAAGTLTPDELTGGTITVSNLGMFGVDTGFALVTKPQAAIVFVGSVAPRPMVVDGAVVARPSLYLSVTYDHRVVDGAAAATFLAALKRRVEGLGGA